MKRIILLNIIMAFFLTACADKLVLKKTEFTKLKGWEKDEHSQALESFVKSCEKIQKTPSNKKIYESGIGGVYGDWKQICNQAMMVDASKNPADARKFFEDNFVPYKAKNGWRSTGRVTGYFEMALKGSRTKHEPYIYPLYKKPSDKIDGQKYFSRKEIDEGALEDKNLELVWVDDPVREFFLQVQGSGRIQLDDGTEMRVGYGGQNGYKYVPIGKYMIEKEYLTKENMSAHAIKDWLYSHPDQAKEVMQANPSYVFFREIKGDGPIGGQGVALTPMRSLAVDKRYIPYGVPVWLNVDLTAKEEQGEKVNRLFVAQDTGGAIKGPIRSDLFFGYGSEAEDLAGYQNSKGRYFLLLPKIVTQQTEL